MKNTPDEQNISEIPLPTDTYVPASVEYMLITSDDLPLPDKPVELITISVDEYNELIRDRIKLREITRYLSLPGGYL